MPKNQSVVDQVEEESTNRLYWFIELEEALEEGDFEKAANAQSELRSRGVQIRYKRLSPCLEAAHVS